MPETAVVPRPGPAAVIGASVGATPGGTTPPIEPRTEPPSRQQFPPQHRLPERPIGEMPIRQPTTWESLDRETLMPELRDIYDTMSAERKKLEDDRAGLTKTWETERKDLTGKLETLNRDYRGLLQALLQSGMLTEDGRLVSPVPTGYREPARTGETRAVTQPPGPDELPQIDWYDPQAVYRAWRTEQATRDERWTQYANDINKWWMERLATGQAYAVAAARLLATDPEFARDPKLVGALFTEAQKYNGDLEKAYQSLKAPIAERAGLEKQIADLKTELEKQKKQQPGLLGVLSPAAPRPIKPMVGTRPSSWGQTGRYQSILSRYDPASFVVPDEELPPEQVAAF